MHEKSENDQCQWKWVYRIKHVKCYRMRIHKSCPTMHFSDLYYFNPRIHGKSENDQFQWKWVYRIKYVKCYQMNSIKYCPIIDFMWFIHERSKKYKFQWNWVYRIKHVKCYRMKSIRMSGYEYLVICTTLIQKYMKKVKMINFNDSGFFGLSTSNAIEWNP